ncbi:MAG: RDD family protein [Epsilonproteobacteria bacterium]|nr:RDD family protein [Campylobacterota bacterium]
MLDDLDRLESEGIKLAPLDRRGWAFFVDELIVSVIFFIIFWDAIFIFKTPDQVVEAINSLVVYLLFIKIIYHTFFVWYQGASPGKMLLKMEVIQESDFENPGFLVSLNRAIGRVISEMLFYLGFVWAFLDPKRQAWHDKLARTLVVDV